MISYDIILWNYNVPQVWNSFANMGYNYGMNGNYIYGFQRSGKYMETILKTIHIKYTYGK
jgi:hypothetical protein